MTPSVPTPKLLDARQLASLLGVHPRTLLRLTRSKAIPSIPIGAQHRYDYAEVLTALKAPKKDA